MVSATTHDLDEMQQAGYREMAAKASIRRSLTS